MSFAYTNSLGRPLRTTKTIKRIVFNIGRYGQYQEQIDFDAKVSEQEAVAAVQQYLSQPLDAEYLARLGDDLFEKPTVEEIARATRGACLSDCTFLEFIQRRGTVATIKCGS
jgi:hypothetical protein